MNPQYYNIYLLYLNISGYVMLSLNALRFKAIQWFIEAKAKNKRGFK